MYVCRLSPFVGGDQIREKTPNRDRMDSFATAMFVRMTLEQAESRFPHSDGSAFTPYNVIAGQEFDGKSDANFVAMVDLAVSVAGKAFRVLGKLQR